MTFFLIFIGSIMAFNIFLASLVAIRGNQSKSWPAVEGIINSFDLHEESTDEGTRYLVKISYCYLVNGISYKSHRLYFDGHVFHYRIPAWHAALLIRSDFKAGYQCKVYYNTRKPSLSTLVPGVKISTFLALLVVGSLVFLFPSERPLFERLI
jgi:hypothetical protein